jgi:hypothetical protein
LQPTTPPPSIASPTPQCGDYNFCSDCQTMDTQKTPSGTHYAAPPSTCEASGGWNYVSRVSVLTPDDSKISITMAVAEGVYVRLFKEYQVSCTSTPSGFQAFSSDKKTDSYYPWLAVSCNKTAFSCLDIKYDIQYGCSYLPTPSPIPLPTSSRSNTTPSPTARMVRLLRVKLLLLRRYMHDLIIFCRE